MKVRTILSLAAASLAIAGSAVVLKTPLDATAGGGGSGAVLVIVDNGTLIPVTDDVRVDWDCPDYAADS
ncbi:hypothetical protein Ait01nite_096200 [Actinoplanes italicus]|uniref:Uncharacterized protein n=1 Tax=Actinoplanes italicus TaxID=113567 RepID=A0A2T0JM13_9ACTN|nr:hypothetical protein [Actinoplanes italicus]PRX08642.1 hypothetical protein CLV67_13929 [Actinoplanes italicus]GIE36575.1 hypothetical protein Ait01nite_096200 [Actinoplanes italicus]